MSKKPRRNRLQGRKAQRVGAAFETLVERSCGYYLNSGRAHIQKTPEPFRMVSQGRNGQVVGFFEKMAQPDFQGTLKNGRSIVFEAKHTNSTNTRFDRISVAQSRELDRHSAFGADCFIIIGFELTNFYMVNWRDWQNLKKSIGKKSVNEKDLKEYGVKYINGVIRFLE